MIDKVSRLAETVATGLSRRGFMRWAGQGALALGAVLGIPLLAAAAPSAKGGKFCCVCVDQQTHQRTLCACGPNPCPPGGIAGSVCTQTAVKNCTRKTCPC